jgi:hypothetical protein
MTATNQHPAVPPSSDGAWMTDTYFPTLAGHQSAALDMLHSATTWGLTLITSALLLVISQDFFPSERAVFMLLATFLASVHFMVRAMKGYINVMRWLVIRSAIMRLALPNELKGSFRSWSEGRHDDRVVSASSAIFHYDYEWRLPLRRRDVFVKGFFELGFGYLIVANIAAVIYTLVAVGADFWLIAATIAGAALSFAEIGQFLASPYMRRLPDQHARAVR